VITVLAFIFVLGVLVFVHELGHFLAAKRVGIRVLKFQLGFNPTIVSFRHGDTEYGIGALPLGGYVKMAGENPEEVERDEHGNPIVHPDEFLAKTKWQRFQVLIMGPIMNLLLAVTLTAVVNHHGMEKGSYENQPVIVGVVTEGSPAAKAGIQPGDKIVSVGGDNVDTWNRFLNTVATVGAREVDIVLPNVHPHVGEVSKGSAAERAGLKTDDVVLDVDGKPITFSYQLKEAISKHPEQQIAMSILRGGQKQTILATPARQGEEGLLGIRIGDDTYTDKPPVGEAISRAVTMNIEMSRLIFKTLGGLFTRQTSPKQLMGPIAIAQLSGESAALGWIALISLMASISLNLGLLNLMPVPVLDGGHIFIMALEGLARRDFSQAVKEKMLMAGFAVILMLMVTVIYNDLTRISWIERLMPWR
jgi:regulator of sigma E protease